MPIELPDLFPGGRYAPCVLFAAVAGSRAYGLATASSDEDLRGIFAIPRADYLSLDDPPPPQVNDIRHDTVFYSLRRYLELIGEGNPNSLEILYVEPDCVHHQHPVFDALLQVRDQFVTLASVDRHIGYAQSQMKRARGRNKWVNNPQPESPPELDQFCWFIPERSTTPAAAPTRSAQPGRPVSITDAPFPLAECHVASVEHASHLYRLYHYGPQARGVVRAGQVVCESIPIEDEATHFVGFLVVNQVAFEAAKRDHQNYWQWRTERNDTRWLAQEQGELDYDAKHMMHTVRLLISADAMLSEGRPRVRVTADEREHLLRIRSGDYTWDALAELIDGRIARLTKAMRRSTLPKAVPASQIRHLLYQITEDWERQL